jgi:membrane-associated phospholipid phosphatase
VVPSSVPIGTTIAKMRLKGRMTKANNNDTRTYLRPFGLALLMCILLPHAGHAQSGDTSNTTQPQSAGQVFLSDLKESLNDGATIFLSPLHFSTRGWATVGGTGLVVGGMVAWVDQPVREYFLAHQNPTGDALASFGNFFGTGLIGGVAAVTLYTAGLATRETHLRLMGRHIVQSLAMSGIITTIFKSLFGRARPYLNEGPHAFNGPTFSNDRNSLPSGHVTVATAICASLAEDLHNTWASIGLYALAGSTVYARMYADKHWSSDVVLGGVIGTACGYWTVHLHDSDHDSTGTGLLITPTPGGLFVQYKF